MPRAARLVLVAIILSSWAPARADDLLSPADIAALEARGWLVPSERETRALLGPYAARAERVEGVRLGSVRIARTEALVCVLGRAAHRRLDVARVFTSPLFRDGRLVIAIPPQALRDVDAAFDLHSVFVPEARVKGRAAPVRMQFLVAGGGRLLVGYDGAGSFDHPDPAYRVMLSKTYRVYPFVRMNIATRDGRPALTDLGTAGGPTAPLGPYRGPWGAAISHLVVTPGGVEAVATIDLTLRLPPVSPRDPAATARTLAALGCPADRAWSVRAP